MTEESKEFIIDLVVTVVTIIILLVASKYVINDFLTYYGIKNLGLRQLIEVVFILFFVKNVGYIIDND